MSGNILLVAPCRESLDLLVKKVPAGYHLFTIAYGGEASPVMCMQFIQLIICQVDPEDETGWKFCCRFKQDPVSARIPLIVVTPGDYVGGLAQMAAIGADVHFRAPVAPEQLGQQIRQLMSSATAGGWTRKPQPDRRAAFVQEKEQLLNKLQACLDDVERNHHLNVDKLARLMHMSRPTLYRKIKHVGERTPNELINEVRLKKAAQLLATGEYRIFEVARMTGYASQSSFGKSFLKRFHMTPSTFQRMKNITDAA